MELLTADEIAFFTLHGWTKADFDNEARIRRIENRQLHIAKYVSVVGIFLLGLCAYFGGLG